MIFKFDRCLFYKQLFIIRYVIKSFKKMKKIGDSKDARPSMTWWRMSLGSWAISAASLALSAMQVEAAASCHQKATWPKLIGYGTADTEVVSVDRCSSNGKLALAIKTLEDEFVKNATAPSSQVAPLMLTQMNPSTEQYEWAYVVNKVYYTTDGKNPPFLFYTPDCSKIVVHTIDENQLTVIFYIEPSNGSYIDGFQNSNCCPDVRKGGISTDSSGKLLYYIDARHANYKNFIYRKEFDSSNNKFKTGYAFARNEILQIFVNLGSKYINNQVLYAEHQASKKVLTFLTQGSDPSFSATDPRGDQQSTRLDIWDYDFANLSSPSQSRSKEDIVPILNLYPKLIKLSAAEKANGTELVVMNFVQYVDITKIGIVRTNLKANFDFNSTDDPDEEKIADYLQMIIVSVHYQSVKEVYAIANKFQDSSTYLVKIDLNSSTASYFKIRGLESDPNGTSGGSIQDAFIYANNSESGNYPAKGFIVGKTKKISAYNNFCVESDFSLDNVYYKCFEKSKYYGFVERIELDKTSCKRESVVSTKDVTLTSGTGRASQKTLYLCASSCYDKPLSDSYTITYSDMASTSQFGISAGAWESSIVTDFAECSILTADPKAMTFTQTPSFDSSQQNPLLYHIKSGQSQLSFSPTWLASDGGSSCSVYLIEYKKLEKSSGSVSDNLGLVNPSRTQSSIAFQTTDEALNGREHSVILLAIANNQQCVKIEHKVTPVMCKSSLFDQLTWTKSDMYLHTMDYVLNGEEVVLDFSKIKHSFEQFCPTLYFFLEYRETTDRWQPYTDEYVKLEGDKTRVKIKADHLDKELYDEFFKFRVSVAAVDDLSTAQYPGFLELDVTFVNACSYMTLELIRPYKHIQSQVLTTQKECVTFPGAQTKPYPDNNCGGFSFELGRPVPSKLYNLLTLSNDGRLTLKPPSEGTAGYYYVNILVKLEQFPTVSLTASVLVNIAKCIPNEVIAPVDHFTEIEHQIGSTVVTKQDIGVFKKIQDCKEPLKVKVLTQNGEPLPSKFNVQIKDNEVQVFTIDRSLAGTHNLKVVAYAALMEKVRASFNFQLKLYAPGENKFDDLVISVDSVGPFLYELPKYMINALRVDLGNAESFLAYDAFESTISKSDETYVIAKGIYKIYIIGQDQQTDQAWQQTILFMVRQKDQVEDQLCCRRDYVVPRIADIDVYGLVTVKWSKPMKMQDLSIPNQTEESRELSVRSEEQDPSQGSIRAHSPAFHVVFAPSEFHTKPPTMNWNFVKWVDEETMQIQLLFDKPTHVSMEKPNDFLEITFRDQTLFMAQDNSFVEAGKFLTKTIRPQVEKGIVVEVVEETALMARNSLLFTGSSSLGVALISTFALNYLWGMINAVQLAVHLPVFSIQFPGIAALFYQAIFKVATFEFINIEDQVQDIFQLSKEEEAFSDEMERVGIESRNFLKGSGLMLPVLLSLLPVMIITYAVLRPSAQKCDLCKRLKIKFEKLFFWNFYLRTMYEGCIDIALISMMEVSLAESGSWGKIFSYSVSVICLLVLLAIMLWVWCWLKKQDLKDDKIEEKYGTVYEGLKPTNESLIFQQWFILRRLLFAATAFYAMGHLFVSFQVLLNSSLLTVGILMRKVQIEKLGYVTELINEVFILLIQYHMFCFTDYVKPVDTRAWMGISITAFTVLSIAINLLINLVVIVKALLKQCHELFKRCMAKYKRKPEAIKEPYLQPVLPSRNIELNKIQAVKQKKKKQKHTPKTNAVMLYDIEELSERSEKDSQNVQDQNNASLQEQVESLSDIAKLDADVVEEQKVSDNAQDLTALQYSQLMLRSDVEVELSQLEPLQDPIFTKEVIEPKTVEENKAKLVQLGLNLLESLAKMDQADEDNQIPASNNISTYPNLHHLSKY